MAFNRDYYEVLGVPRGVNDEVLKSAFLKLAKQYHPDVSKEPDAEEKFKEANNAYEVLSDAKKRAMYDRFGHEGVAAGFNQAEWESRKQSQNKDKGSQGGRTGTDGSSWFGGGFGDMFNDFFANIREGMGEVEQEIYRKRAAEAARDKRENTDGGGEGKRGGANPSGSGKRDKPHIKFGLPDLKIPIHEFNLIAGLMKAEKTDGPVQIENGNYRIIKDDTGAVRVEVKLMRFQPDGTEIRIRPPKGLESKEMKKYDWVDTSWITPLTVEGITCPTSYKDLIQTANEAALRAVHEGKWEESMIKGLNACGRVSFPLDLKKVVKGEEAVELLTKEGDRWHQFEEHRRGDQDRGRDGHRDGPGSPHREGQKHPRNENPRPPRTEAKPVADIPKPSQPPRGDSGNINLTGFVGGRRR